MNIYVVLLLAGLAGIHCTAVDIDNDKIYNMVNNSCQPIARRRRSADLLQEIHHRSAAFYQRYQKLFPEYCNSSVPSLPVSTNESMIGSHYTVYYTWMLWVKYAEDYMYSVDSMRNEDLNITELDGLVNYIRQGVCILNADDAEIPILPEARHSTDPVDYRQPICTVLRSLVQWSAVPTPTSTITPPSERRRRKGRRVGLSRQRIIGKRSVSSVDIRDGEKNQPSGSLIEKLKPSTNGI